MDEQMIYKIHDFHPLRLENMWILMNNVDHRCKHEN